MITPESQSSTQIHQDDTSSTGSALALIKFPVRLFELLEAADTNPSLASIISWTSDGCGFRVRCHKSFERRILPGIFPSMKVCTVWWLFDEQGTEFAICQRCPILLLTVMHAFWHVPFSSRHLPRFAVNLTCMVFEREPQAVSSAALLE